MVDLPYHIARNFIKDGETYEFSRYENQWWKGKYVEGSAGVGLAGAEPPGYKYIIFDVSGSPEFEHWYSSEYEWWKLSSNPKLKQAYKNRVGYLSSNMRVRLPDEKIFY